MTGLQYQIRFLGFKGVVGVDEQLDGNPNGILMRLRPSMKKFENSHAILADIEIAQSFEHPNKCYLNRYEFLILYIVKYNLPHAAGHL
jgi:RNA-dependent RNA polymerase